MVGGVQIQAGTAKTRGKAVNLGKADTRICVVGLGYVGLTLAAVMADVGFEVHGVEQNDALLATLMREEAPFFEKGLSTLIGKIKGRISYSKAIPADCAATVYIITVGTPLDAEGKVNLEAMRQAVTAVGECLRDGDLVILRSTVRLGVTKEVAEKILDQTGKSYELAFCPERTSEGQALKELRTLPQIIGSPDRQTRQRVAQIFNTVTPTIVHVDTFEGAELIKLIDNSYRDTMFAFANEVARICDAIGLDASSVISAGNLGYPRTNVLRPGTVGGPCLEKDPHVLIEGLKPYGITPELIATGRFINERQPFETVGDVKKIVSDLRGFPDTPRIAMLGLAFKGRPETDDLRGTTALHIMSALEDAFPKAKFRCYDPVVKPEDAERVFQIEVSRSPEEACDGANLVMILNNHVAFEVLSLEHIAEKMGRPALIYDYWANFRSRDLDLPEGVKYVTLGGIIQASQPRTRM